MKRLILAALSILTAAHAQTIVGPNAGSTLLPVSLQTATAASDSWLTIVPGPQSQAVAYSANPNPNARIATVTAAGVKYPIVQASATGVLTPWGPLGYGNIRTIAGVALSGFSGDNGPAANAQVDSPEGIAIDANGNVYISDSRNNRIRKISATTGIISTVAGNGTNGFSGDGGPATAASLGNPQGIALDPAGNLYIADLYNGRIRKVTAATGIISTVGAIGNPARIAVAPNGDLIVTMYTASFVIRLNPATGVFTVIAGTGIAGFAGDGGPALTAQLNNPQGVAVDPAGNIYIAEIYNKRVRKITAAGIISTIVGTGAEGVGGDNGPAILAQYSGNGGLAIGPDGNLYLTDRLYQRVRRVNLSTGIITTIAGASPNGIGDISGDGGPATAAWLQSPADLAFDPAGNLYTCEFRVIRYIDYTSPVLAIAPASPTVPATAGSAAITVTPTPATAPWFATTPAPWLTLSQTGTTLNYTYTANPSATPRSAVVRVNTDTVLITQQGSAVSLTPATATVLATAGSGTLALTVSPAAPWTATSSAPWLTVSPTSGTAGNTLTYTYTQNTGTVARTASIQVAGRTFTLVQPATTGAYTPWSATGRGSFAEILSPAGAPYALAVDPNGAIFFSDNAQNSLYRLTSTSQTTIAGSNIVNSPYGLAIDFAGNIYLADAGTSRILKCDATTGTFSTLVPATELNRPLGVAVDPFGNLFIADTSNHRIRRYDAATGLLTTIAGTGVQGANGDFPNPLDAQLSSPYGIALDRDGNVYFSEFGSHRVRRINAIGGALVTLLTPAQVNSPRGIAVDPAGNLYVADFGNARVIKRLAATGQFDVVPTTANGRAASPIDVALDPAGNLYIADYGYARVLVLDNSSPAVTIAPSGSNTLSISPALPGAYWSLSTNVSWITLSATSGAGAASVTYSTTPNSTFALRTGTIFNGASTFTITQPAVSISFAPPVALVPPTAGTGATSLTLSSPATWGAFPSASWLTLTNATNPLGYAYTANTASFGRMAALNVSGYPFTVVQPSSNGTVSPWGPTALGNIETIAGNGDPAVLNQPTAVAVDANGNLFIADTANGRIVKYDAATRLPSTLAANLVTPSAIAPYGTIVYFADASAIKAVDLSTGSVFTVSAIPGVTALAMGRAGMLYYAAPAGISVLNFGNNQTTSLVTGYGAAHGLAVDLAGNLFFSETFTSRVHRRDAITGTITNIAGTGNSGFSGEGLPGVNARLFFPKGLALDRDGNLFIADSANYRVRKLSAATGLITTIAGQATFGFAGDGGPAANATLQQVAGLAIDGAGNLYLAGNQDNRIRFIDYISPGLSQTFTIPAPATGRVYFVLNPDAATPANSCHGFFDRATNSVVLYNDTLTAFVPSLQNSQCGITNVSSTATDFTMALTRLGAYATGSQTLFTWAVPGNNGWQPFATWPIGGPALPTVASSAPTTANTLSQTFTVDARNTNRIYFLLNSDTGIPTNTCHGFYDRTTSRAFLYDDALTGLAQNLQNSQCALTSVTNVGDTLTFTLTRQGSYASGNKNLYLWAVGRPGTGEGTGWLPSATWNLAPSFSPLVQTFDIPLPNSSRLYFLLNTTSTIAANSCHGFFDVPTRTLSLYNDTLTALAPNAQNSQCGVTYVASTNNTVTLTFTRQGSYSTGTQSMYIWSNGWGLFANWGLGTAITGTSPSASVQTSQAFAISMQATDRLYFLVNSNQSIVPNGCHGYYDRATNEVYLYNDALTALDPSLQNSQCTISNVSASGNTLNMTVTRKGVYSAGTMNLYLWAVGPTGSGTGWTNAVYWPLPSAAQPSLISTTLTQPSVVTMDFVFTVRDTTRLYLNLYQNSQVFPGGCHGFYDVPTNSLFLYNDALTALIGPIQPGTPGSIQNSQCQLATTSTPAVLTTNGLAIPLTITRRGGYVRGNLNLYAWPINATSNGAGWLQSAYWNIP